MKVPNIDYGLCTGCGGCAEAYPRFFEIRDNKAWVVNSEEIDEALHQGVLLICPYYAIEIV